MLGQASPATPVVSREARVRVLTDFPNFPKQWESPIEGTTLTSLTRSSPRFIREWLQEIRQADLIVIQQSLTKVFWLIFLFTLQPSLRKPIVLVDAVLRKPTTLWQTVRARFIKVLLDRVDHFIHYFRELNGYELNFGITPSRSSYVPFKANLYGDRKAERIAVSEKDEYVFAAGWSLRDYDTFFEAISQIEVPAAIPQPMMDRLQEHGARFTRSLDHLPKNLVMLDNDGSHEAWIRALCKARIVVIPVLRETLRAAGVSVYMDAMILGKCVIASDGPGISDVLTNEALIVPPEDPRALAEAIQKVWNDPVLRQDIAQRGQQYAASLGGEKELMHRILDSAVGWYLEYQEVNS
jgi:glycosyltransferase involved in cell wall biosynthesis